MKNRVRYPDNSRRAGVALLVAILLCLTAGGLTLSMVKLLTLWTDVVAAREWQQQSELLAEAGVLLADSVDADTTGTGTRIWTIPFDGELAVSGQIHVTCAAPDSSHRRAVTIVATLGDSPPQLYRSRVQATRSLPQSGNAP